MTRRLRLHATAVFLALLTTLTASAARTQQPATSQQPDAVRRWLRAALQPLTLDGDAANATIARLSTLCGQCIVVGLGESAHHKHELQLVRLQLTKALVEHHGFAAIAMETGYAEALAIDDWLRDRAAPEPDFSRALPFAGDGEQEKLRAALHWMKSYNLRNPKAGRLRFVGIDMSSGGGALQPPLEVAWAYLDRVDPAFATGSRARLSGTLRSLGSGYPMTAKVRFDSLSVVDRARLSAGVAALRERLTSRRTEYIRSLPLPDYERAEHAIEVAEQTLEFMRHDGRDPSNPRDHALARNVSWALAGLPPSTKLVVWAHNAHMQKQPIDVPQMHASAPSISMGRLLADSLGARYVAIGTVVDRFPPDSARADPESVDGVFASLGVPAYLVALRDGGAGGPVPPWLSSGPRLMRFQEIYIRVTPALAFDALVFLEQASPAVTVAATPKRNGRP